MKLEVIERDPEVSYSSAIEAGDYLPYFYIEHGKKKLDVQVKATNFNLFVFPSSELTKRDLDEVLKIPNPITTFFITAHDSGIDHPRLFYDENVFRLFADDSCKFTVCLSDKNLKVISITSGEEFSTLLKDLPRAEAIGSVSTPPPILVVPNVISASLADACIQYFEKNKSDVFKNDSDYKSRMHLHPSSDLRQKLDDKLCKSLLPEISKIYYSDIGFRETYKICCYDAEDGGAFGKHRDTIDPYLHRRFAMSLILNDDFEGGGICFPEYSDQVVSAPKYSAIIFPGSLYHQVIKIESGRRYVIISFLFSEGEAGVNARSDSYRFTVKRDLCGLSINRLSPDQAQ